MEEQVFWFGGICLLVFLLVMIWGEHTQDKQYSKDVKEIADMDCSDETKVKLFAALFREQANRDL